MHKKQNNNAFETARQRMLKWNLKGRDITDSRVLAVMTEVPREEFVPDSHKFMAYNDGPLPIGMEQTISQPYIVALMTQELKVNKNHHVLEIGTGSGYQTAILSKLAKKVYTIERIAELSESAQIILGKLGCDNIEFKIGDGSKGWPEAQLPESGYFDRIIVTAAVPEIPGPLIKQLTDGGLMVIPVGYADIQELILSQKKGNSLMERNICDVRFVKLIGEHAFGE